jgi:inner membrane protein
MDNVLSTFWNRNKIILKSLLIGFLILLLLIPQFFIQNLVSERQERQKAAASEVSAKWAGAQTITGPVIALPYLGKDADSSARMIKKYAFFLPDRLNIRSHIVPEKRYRGIYQVMVYTTELQIDGTFGSLQTGDLDISPEKVMWNEAAVFLNISDLRGLQQEVRLRLDGTDLDLVPAKLANYQFKTALSAILPSKTPGNFSLTMKLKGSGDLLFSPVGKTTMVEATSSWPNPSFTGNYLPDLRTVKDSGFIANWNVLYLNRPYPQQWKDERYDLEGSAFGVQLIVPVDAYQQTTRSVKYAILCILFTFTAFFLIELIYSRAIHSLQYLLAGAALCVFYTLLLSFSEYLGFPAAYGLASLATIVLIVWYLQSVLRSTPMAVFVGCLLTLLYGFIFVLIQLEDYALLMGSIGLFLCLAAVMYFSRKIKWNG